ncbi:MAG: hypothetical protein SNJ70_09150 [Armatimonadota bacterium]
MKITINPGVCGLVSKVDAVSEDMQNVTLKLESDCAKLQKLVDLLGSVDAYQEIGERFQGPIYTSAQEAGCCAGCSAVSGISKIVQQTAGLALPGDVCITFEE